MNIKQAIQNITHLITKSKPKQEETTSVGYPREISISPELDQIRLHNNRTAIIADCRTMYNERGQVFSIIQTIAAYLNKGGYVIMVSPKEQKLSADEQKTQDILNAVDTRIKLPSLLLGWMIPLVRDGVLPIEIEVANNQVAGATKLEAAITFQRVDKKGRSIQNRGEIDLNNAYYQRSLYGGELCQLADWQTMWIEWSPIQGEVGLPQFSSTRKLYKRLEKAEENQSISRTTKSGYKLHHKIGTADNPGDEKTVNAYKHMNRDVLGKPLAVAKDYFSNGMVEINEITGDSRPISVVDVQYQQAQLFGVGGVPLALIPGQEGSIIRDSTGESVKGFVSWIKTCNAMIGEHLKKSIFDLELLLNGINPESINYSIVWGTKLDNNREIEEKGEVRAGRAAGLLSQETAMRMYGIVDVEIEKERINKEMAEFSTVPVERGTAYSVGSNPLGLVGGLKIQGMRERRLKHEERLMSIVAMNEIAMKVGKKW